MKKIILLIIVLIISSSVSLVSAATTLKPSLTTQMKKQEQVNKKNDIQAKLREQARLRQEAKEKLQAQKLRALAAKNKALEKQTTNTTSQTKTLTPTLTIPPVPQKIQTPTIQPSISAIIPSNNIPSPQNVDMNRVRSTWASWYNDVRKSQGLGSYTYDTRLNATAYDWNIEFAKGQGLNHHTRNPGDGYYNFSVIDNWFMARGVDPKVINRSKHTENVGYGSYSCTSGDCTDSLIRSIRSTFDFFMSEKGKAYDLHYRSIVQPYFTKIGLSVITVPSENRYYLVVHYITE